MSSGEDKKSADLEKKFREFSLAASKFSREVFPPPADLSDLSKTAEANLRIARTIFGKWSLEILVLLYSLKRLGFEQMRKILSPISRRVLSQKLKLLEKNGMVKRTVMNSRPLRVEYRLTDRGLVVAKLGEPVFLYLRLNVQTDAESKGAE